MATPHHVPVNIQLTNNLRGRSAIPNPVPDTAADRALAGQHQGFEVSRAALERMIANGWKGYPTKARRLATSARKAIAMAKELTEAASAPAPICEATRKVADENAARAWIEANPDRARDILNALTAQPAPCPTLRKLGKICAERPRLISFA